MKLGRNARRENFPPPFSSSSCCCCLHWRVGSSLPPPSPLPPLQTPQFPPLLSQSLHTRFPLRNNDVNNDCILYLLSRRPPQIVHLCGQLVPTAGGRSGEMGGEEGRRRKFLSIGQSDVIKIIDSPPPPPPLSSLRTLSVPHSSRRESERRRRTLSFFPPTPFHAHVIYSAKSHSWTLVSSRVRACMCVCVSETVVLQEVPIGGAE